MTNTPETFDVDPSRLALGQWSHEFNETVREGDIAASYCADTIALEKKTRKPFIFRGDLWVAVSRCGGVAEAYRLVPIDDFNAAAVGYSEKTKDCEAARGDPDGFYHGVGVKFRKDWFVLNGPPAVFIPGQVQQPGLFGGMP